MMVVFLWLGNVSLAQTDDGWQWTSIDLWNSTIPGSQWWNWTAPTTPSANNVNMNTTSEGNPTNTSSTVSIPQWTPCAEGSKPDWWVYNSINQCVCRDGYKNVNNVCTSCKAKWVCCGVELNTSVPFIGKCIEDSSSDVGGDETWVTWDQAFPVLMSSMMKILVTVILIVSFVLIIVGGIMIAVGNPSGGKKMIIKVVIGIALLGASGVILRLINPNFFG